jgi:DnaK suppressor protein
MAKKAASKRGSGVAKKAVAVKTAKKPGAKKVVVPKKAVSKRGSEVAKKAPAAKARATRTGLQTQKAASRAKRALPPKVRTQKPEGAKKPQKAPRKLRSAQRPQKKGSAGVASVAKKARAAKAPKMAKERQRDRPPAPAKRALRSTEGLEAGHAGPARATAARGPSKVSGLEPLSPTKTAPRAKPTPLPKPKPKPRPKPKPKPKPKRGPYADDEKFLEEQRRLLLAERLVYQEQAEDLRAEAESLALEREPGDAQFDEESGEGGTVAVDRERDLTLSAQAVATIEEIDLSLAAIDAKTYGTCENCGQPVPKARLRALPYARLCVACKSGGLHRR